MAYALAGIPLMLLYMSSVGDILASAFRYAYFNFLCRGSGRRRKPSRRFVGSSRTSRRATRVDCDDSDSDFSADATFDRMENGGSGHGGPRRRGSSRTSKAEKQIPVWACLSVIAGFVAGGATLFSAWEGWPLLDAAYFCVVSLVTVGFGDLVPGDAFRGADITEITKKDANPAASIGQKEALSTQTESTNEEMTDIPFSSAASRVLLVAEDYVDSYEYLDLLTTTTASEPATTEITEELTPAFGGVFSDYVTTKDMMMVDGKLTFCALYLLTGMALLAMNFHLMQETGLRAARRVLDRLRPSWGESKRGARERSVPTAAVCTGVPHSWSRSDGWRRRTWAGEGRRFGGDSGKSAGKLQRRGSWAEGRTDQWESGTEDGLDPPRMKNTVGTGPGNGGGVQITLQAEDGEIYDWEPGGDEEMEREYAVSMETIRIGNNKSAGRSEDELRNRRRSSIGSEDEDDDISEDECRGVEKETMKEVATGAYHRGSADRVKLSRSSSHRSTGTRWGGVYRGDEEENDAISGGPRVSLRLDVPQKSVVVESARRLQRSMSRSPAPEISLVESPSSDTTAAETLRSKESKGTGSDGTELEKDVSERGGARRGVKGKRVPMLAWRKRRKRKKGVRRTAGGTGRQSGFRNPFFSTSSLDRIPSDC